MATDGTIRVGTKLDMSGIKKDIKELERELARVQKESAKVQEKMDKVSEAYSAEREIDSQVPKEYSHKDDIDRREAEAMGPLIEQQQELAAKASEFADQLARAREEKERIASISSANDQLSQFIKDEKIADSITSQEQYNSILEETEYKMARIEEEAERIAQATGVNKEELLANNAAYQKLADTQRVLTTRTFEFGEEANNAGKKASDGMIGAKDSAIDLSKAVTKGIKTMKRLVFAAFGARGAFALLRQSLRAYMADNETLSGQITTLKNLFGQVLGPAIEFVVNMIIKAISAVNAFIYALTGINLIAKANASALKSQSKAASDAQKALQPAGFDEQTKLTDTSSGGGGSGGAVALPDGTTLDLSFLDPLKNALLDFWEDIQPLLDTIKSLGKWVLDNVLLPFAEWCANSFIPSFLDTLSKVLLVLNGALLTLQPIALWIWENILEPIANWTGGVIIDVLTAISDWINRHANTLSSVAAVILGIIIAVKGVSLAMSALSVVIGILTSPIAIVVAAITGLIVLFVTLYDECEGFRKGVQEA